MPVSVTSENYTHEIAQSALPVVIDVYATWCGPCQHMAPLFAELEQEVGTKYKFAKINVDQARDLAIQFGVTSVPTFIFIKNNSVLGKATGYMNKADLLKKIEQLLGR